MRAFGHFRSLDKDGWRSYHSIRHSWKPHAAHKLYGSIFYRTEVTADHSFTMWEQEFLKCFLLLWLDLDPMTYTNLTRILSRCTRCVQMNFLCRGFWKLSYYRHRDIHTPPILLTTRVHRWSEIKNSGNVHQIKKKFIKILMITNT